MMNPQILAFAISIFVANLRAEPAWFQVCDKTQKFQLNSADCSRGLWLKRPLNVECVCVHGVWAISSGYCDEEAQLLVGGGDCFNVHKSVRHVLLLGNPEAPFSPAAYVVTSTFHYYAKVPLTGYNQAIETDDLLLVAINPNETLKRSDREVCLEVAKGDRAAPVHIWKIPRRESHRFKWLQTGSCITNPEFDHHVSFGQLFSDSVIQETETVAANCSYECPSSPERRNSLSLPQSQPHGRGILFQNVENSKYHRSLAGSDINWDRMDSLKEKLSVIEDPDLEDAEKIRQKNAFLTRLRLSQPAAAYKRETREQTIRLLQSQWNFLLLDQPPVKINAFEYEYFQMALQIFSSVVPNDIVPPKMINVLMRMWRQLLWESHDKFSQADTPNPAQHERTMATLAQCYANVSQHPMLFVNKVNASSHRCLNETVATFWNDTQDPEQSSQHLMIFFSNTTIPKEVKFIPHKLDFVVEFAWKVILFTIYHCSDWFRLSALDHSYLSAKLLSFFNYDIMKRWYNPEDSLKAYQFIFQGINLYDVAFATDRVVEAARDGSAFQMWLNRPSLPISEEDLPPRRKRSVRRTIKGFHFWGRNAACVHKLSDPVIRFGYHPPRDCYSPWDSAGDAH